MQSDKKQIFIRIKLILIFFTLFAFIIIGKIFYAQIKNKELLKNSTKLLSGEKIIPASRGNILDCNGHILATSIPMYTIAIDPSLITEEDFIEKVPKLSKCLENSLKEKFAEDYFNLIKNSFKKNIRYMKISNKKINHNEKLEIETWPLFHKSKDVCPGILEKVEVRFKPFKDLFSRGIGYINQNAKVGIESTYNKELAGKPGNAMYKKILGSNWKKLSSSVNKEPIHGYDIQTTIDINLQDIANQSLLDVLEEAQGDYGCLILMEVKTGEIKAMVNLTKSKNDKYEENYNYTIGDHGIREPGSVFKLVSMIAILETGNVNLDSEIETTPHIYWHNTKLNESNYVGWGTISIRESFIKSSNTAITKLIVEQFEKNPEKFITEIKRLKFDLKTEINIEGEGNSFIPQPKTKNWSGISLPWLSIGYGLEVSPMQIVQLYNAVANNGVMVKPKIVKNILHGNKIIKTFPTEIVVKKICSKKNLMEIKNMLKGVVDRGTARFSRDSFYKIAGKSGTANTLENGKYSKKTYTTFVGYFPEENPKYSCIVCIDNPRNLKWHYGGKLSWVVKQIADKISSQDLDYYKLG